MEKISLTRSHINRLGLRGDDMDAACLDKQDVVLCFGDSMTYGYPPVDVADSLRARTGGADLAPLYIDRCHPNERVARLIAEAVAEEILTDVKK